VSRTGRYLSATNGFYVECTVVVDGIREKTASLTRPTRVASPVVDPYDIARIAALALTEDGHVGHGYILNGPEALTAREQVGIISDV